MSPHRMNIALCLAAIAAAGVFAAAATVTVAHFLAAWVAFSVAGIVFARLVAQAVDTVATFLDRRRTRRRTR